MRNVFFVLFATICWALSAQSLDAGKYLHTTQGLQGEALKNALHNLIQPQTIFSYGGGEGHTWEGFAKADDMGNGTVRDRYSSQVRRFNGYKAVDGMNIEHIWANSWWGHTVNNAYCDLFNLYPADRDANGHKSNNPIGVVNGAVAFDNGMTLVGMSDSYQKESLITAWEPANEWKGDFARTYFYMATAYQHMTDEWQTTEGLLTVDPTSWQTMRPWVYELMLEWAEADPVDDIERNRNEVIASIQGNRNPFVDWPALADYVWGERVGENFYLEPASIEPELFVPQEAVTIDFGMQALSLGLHRNVAVRGRNFTHGLRATIEGDGFGMTDAELTSEEVLAGVQLPVVSTVTEAGDYEATLILSDANGFQQLVPLRMTMLDGIPAYPALDITNSQYKKSFTASWMDMHLAEGERYTVNVYSYSAKGEKSAVKGSPFETVDTFLVVNNGLSASKTYYYTVSNADSTLVSNEVQVDIPAITPTMDVPAGQLLFSTMPDIASEPQSQRLSVKFLPSKENEVSITCTSPFEFSFDGETWENECILVLPATSDTTFQVRLAAVEAVGSYEGELVISTTSVKDIVQSLVAIVDKDRGFFESFELNKKGGYAAADLQCSAALWNLSDVIIASDNCRNDHLSARLKVGGRAEMLEDAPLGCDSLWFWAGLYNNDTGANLTVCYSIDSGETWTPVVEELAFSKGEWKRYGYRLDVSSPLRLRFAATGINGKRINFDDVQMSCHSSQLVVPVAPMEWMSEATAPTLVYTLDGRYLGGVMPARRGIYIVRRGSQFTKQTVR